jgi:hypothetical protein
MKITLPNGNVASLTEAQIISIVQLASRFGLTGTIEVIPEFRSDAVLMVAGGMTIGIEADGYAHT